VTTRTGLVCVLVPVVYDLYFSAILSGVAQATYEHDVHLTLSPTMHDHARESSILDRLTRGATDGTIVILPETSSADLVEVVADGHPLVVIDPLVALDERIPSVAATHRSGADQAMRHLLELGHRRIAAIAGPPGWMATEERRRGYRAALEASRIAHDPELEVDADFEIGPGAEAAASLLRLPEPPTAIFAFNDAIAIGAMRAARERGLRVPEDVSVVGFDDIKYATIVTPALTTVRQPLAEMGRAAVRLLLELVECRASETHHVELITRLAVRDSTAPPPARADAP
jgi:LacI family transcriptional regulator, galactose operon repressor